MESNLSNIKFLLDDRVKKYNHLDFIESDPIQIPHRFNLKEDIEIAGLLVATIAWGQRKSIINNGNKLMDLMDNSPYQFLMSTNFTVGFESTLEYKHLRSFVHRTFNGEDVLFFLKSLQNIYLYHGGLETVFTNGYKLKNSVYEALKYFRDVFLSLAHNHHVRKHVSDVANNSSAKRLNMFLRWMVRCDENEVDFGLWKEIPKSALMLPLDVHTGDVGRALGILNRNVNDWKAVEEITAILRNFDPADPIKYDFALFGIGAFKEKELGY